jgi:predicted lipase
MQVIPPYPAYNYFRRPESATCPAQLADLAVLSYEVDPFITNTLAKSPFKLKAIITSGDIQAIITTIGQLYVVSFRGTTSLQDWLIDLDFEKNDQGIHRGFYDAVSPLIPKIKDYIIGYPVIFTGHSLGAALTTISLFKTIGATTSSSLVTFGSPRVGDALFAKTVQREASLVLRYVHGEDIVPTVPMEDLGFQHVGDAIQLKQMPRPLINFFCPRHIFDHVPTNYSERLWEIA